MAQCEAPGPLTELNSGWLVGWHQSQAHIPWTKPNDVAQYNGIDRFPEW